MSNAVLKDNFRGHGALVPLADDLNMIAAALNNATVITPKGYQGAPPRIYVSGGDSPSLVLDMGDAAIFNPARIDYVVHGDTLQQAIATLTAGVLKIEITV